METTLHRVLKDQYRARCGGRCEVWLNGFRIDTVVNSGELVEIQSGALGPLRWKLQRLLPEHRMRIVKPIIIEKRVVRRMRRDGSDLSMRKSPKRGAIVDLFEDFVGLARVFPHPHLIIELLLVNVDEIRLPRRRRPGYTIVDRRLNEVLGRTCLKQPGDLWELLPIQIDWCQPFTTADIARRIGRPIWFAQRVAYCLRLSGAVRVVGKDGNRGIYSKAGPLSQ
jgi:hypothetical protein